MNDLQFECCQLLDKLCSIKITSKIKFFIKTRKILKNDVAFWPNALLVEALLMLDSEEAKNKVEEINKRWKNIDYRITNYDDYLMGYILLNSENVINTFDKEHLRKTLNDYLEKNDFEIYPYRLNESNKVYVDLLGMLPPYLAYEYSITNNKKYFNKAIQQFEKFNSFAFDKKFLLPYHGYDLKTGNKEGLLAWGRGLGWYLYGLSLTICNVWDTKLSIKEKENLKKMYLEVFDETIKYLKNDGSFSWHVIAKEGKSDSSATALILLSLLRLIDKNILEQDLYTEKMDKMYFYLESCIDGGKILNCSCECGGFGVYPQKYDSYAWSLGPAIMCFIYYRRIKGEKYE